MPRQLIYTSAQRGLTPGQSGYCTVARSRDLREGVIPRIEKLSYYTPEPRHNPIICSYRVLDLRGEKFHVLTRIVDAGLDFTKRRCFLAHHLIFDPREILSNPTPAEIFLNWKGWRDSWEGDPEWIDEVQALPAISQPQQALAKSDLWISGDQRHRDFFLPALAEAGANWNLTFTNCFQPGDRPDDFDIKAAWPGTLGFEAAQRLDAHFISLDDIPKAQPPQAASAAPLLPTSEPPRVHADSGPRSLGYWPYFATALIVIAIAATFRLRPANEPAPTIVPPQPAAPVAPETNESLSALETLLPDKLTWLITSGAPTSIPPAEELMRRLRAHEIFTKDLSGAIQTNLLSPAIPATLFADPQRALLRFTATNGIAVELLTAPQPALKCAFSSACAVEIPGTFRALAIEKPVTLPLRFLTTNSGVELHPTFAGRLRNVELPPGSQLALRPLVESNGQWIDPVAAAARDFSIVPSLILDLNAAHSQAAKLIAEKETKLRAYEDERAKLQAEQNAIPTKATTDEEKLPDRIEALALAIKTASNELDALRAKASAIPNDPKRIDRFALFLCQSNINTEIFRFTDKP